MNKLHEERLRWEDSEKLQILLPDSPHDLVFIVDELGIVRNHYWQFSGLRWPECWL